MKLNIKTHGLIPNGENSQRLATLFTLNNMNERKLYIVEGIVNTRSHKGTGYFKLSKSNKWSGNGYKGVFVVESEVSFECFGIKKVYEYLFNYTIYHEFKLHEFDSEEEFNSYLTMKELVSE